MFFSKKTDPYSKILVPEIADMQLELEQMVQQGLITPEEAQTYLMEGSAYENIDVDPSTRNAQLDSLSQLQDIATQGGLTTIDKARINELQTTLSNQERGQRESILQNAQQRGVGGSGLELAAQMQNQQNSAQRASQQAMDIEAQAQQRALDAILQSGQLGGQIRTQDYNQASDIARAKDAINQFNTQNKQNVSNKNVDARNAAQVANLQEKQRVADGNTSIRNNQQTHNKGLVQQNFNNNISKAGGVLQQNQANNQSNKDNNEIIGGAISALALASDENVKTDIKPFDASEFLNELTGYRYNYKKPEKHGEGAQVGIMAQDLEKVAPQAVQEDHEGVKRVDYSKLGGPILASLSDLAKRVNVLEDK